LEQAVLKLRREYSRWGKDKLAVLLRGAGHAVSVSMVGRILSPFKRRGVLVDPVFHAISARKAAPQRAPVRVAITPQIQKRHLCTERVHGLDTQALRG